MDERNKKGYDAIANEQGLTPDEITLRDRWDEIELLKNKERQTLINFLKWYLSQDMKNYMIVPYKQVDEYLEQKSVGKNI
jgi:hypothetical protein